jgi:hypothetical protein
MATATANILSPGGPWIISPRDSLCLAVSIELVTRMEDIYLCVTECQWPRPFVGRSTTISTRDCLGNNNTDAEGRFCQDTRKLLLNTVPGSHTRN